MEICGSGLWAHCRWRTGKSDCYAIPAPRLLGQKLGVHCMAIDSDTVWVDGGTTGIWQLNSGRWKHYDELPELKLWLKSCLVDHEGGLWFGDVSQGVIRHVGSRLDRFDRVDGLSGDTVTAIF